MDRAEPRDGEQWNKAGGPGHWHIDHPPIDQPRQYILLNIIIQVLGYFVATLVSFHNEAYGTPPLTVRVCKPVRGFSLRLWGRICTILWF